MTDSMVPRWLSGGEDGKESVSYLIEWNFEWEWLYGQTLWTNLRNEFGDIFDAGIVLVLHQELLWVEMDMRVRSIYGLKMCVIEFD